MPRTCDILTEQRLSCLASVRKALNIARANEEAKSLPSFSNRVKVLDNGAVIGIVLNQYNIPVHREHVTALLEPHERRECYLFSKKFK